MGALETKGSGGVREAGEEKDRTWEFLKGGKQEKQGKLRNNA